MTLRLAAFSLITSLFVGVIYVVTKPLIIEAKEEARIAQLYALAEPLLSNGAIQTPVSKELPSGAPTPLERPLVITPIADSSGQIGSVIPFRSTEGYSGTIQLLIALDQDQRIVGLRAINHKETPGLGDKIDTRKTDWILSFNGLSYGDLSPNDWAVDKDGGRFDSFTGATITPRAVVNALRDTLSYFNANPELLEVSP
jgi:electron transport complex protein RnfG